MSGSLMKNASLTKRYTFDGSALPVDWSIAAVGAGQSVAVGSGKVSIYDSTYTINAETILQCSQPIRPRCKVRFVANASAVNANRKLIFELVNAAGTSYAQFYQMSGTTTTYGAISASGGNANTAKSFTSGPAFTSPVVIEIKLDVDKAIFSVVAADGGAITTIGGTYDGNFPGTEEDLYLRVRMQNQGTTPGAVAYLYLQNATVCDFEPLNVTIHEASGLSMGNQALPIYGAGGSIGVTGTATVTPATPSASLVVAAASTNATSVKASAGTIFQITVSNEHTSAQYLKIYNKASAPTVGTDQPILTIPIPASSMQTIDFGAQGLRLATGIALAITGLMPYTDTTVATANGVRSTISYI